MTPQVCCDRYIELFENLTPPRLDELSRLVSDEVHFRDPFNDVRGRAAMRRVLEDMFERTQQPRFRVSQRSVEGDRAFLAWTFSARAPVLGNWSVDGVSLLQFDGAGRVASHLDYWDSGRLYARLPLLGCLIRRLRRRLSANS
ncbi:MAG: nuclear transport factor 2 family protein [Oceanospirillaceae bacterium]|nr:nuclear transport factor 2 family protein [Oceanospirillaceae bacterium]